MKLTQFVDEVAARSGMSKRQARAVINAATDVIREVLANQDRIRIPGLGTFDSAWRPPRTIRSVQNARKIEVEGSWYPRFRPTSDLKEHLRGTKSTSDPGHAEATRVATTLTSDMLLYSGGPPPELPVDAEPADVRHHCALHFGGMWTDVVTAYEQRVPEALRQERDHLAQAALQVFDKAA